MQKSKLYKGSLRTIVLKLINKSHLWTASLLLRYKEFAFEAKRWYDVLLFSRRNGFVYQDYILDMVEVKTFPVLCQPLSCYFSDS